MSFTCRYYVDVNGTLLLLENQQNYKPYTFSFGECLIVDVLCTYCL
jgi:hypothetical protein